MAQIEPAANDHGLGPAGIFPDVLRLELALEAVSAGRCLDERYFAALIAENEVAVGKGPRRRAVAWPARAAAPGDLARFKLQANRHAVVVPVPGINVAVLENHLPVVVL